ncbi:hypothetical protein [Pontibacillus marinus]|uniref:Lipoprotein n=1 Tax=Pontibacillus marinus BH030004 = DSM 16465 TaxID=1385511 RepID=A0A0A5HN99_9BACI|nr:hypothetical protein [Pontibacillus marinus]KGX85102.1 hypothetical protein N783_15305 [Pontibacillus marinus BH030004 = DSM 16465]
MKRITKHFKSIALSGILLFSVGCTDSNEESKSVNPQEESESVQNIRSILQEELNGPNEELDSIWDGLHSAEFGSEKYKEYFEKRGEYIKEHFKPYVSKRFYEAYAIKSNMANRFLRDAYRNGYELNVEDIMIKESETTENSYNFTVDVSYVKDGNNDPQTIQVKGLMNTNEEGKVVRIHLHNSSELDYAIGEPAKGHIHFVLNKKFNSHEQLDRILNNDSRSIGDYVEERLLVHYSEKVDEMDVKIASLNFQEIAHENGYKLKAEEITLEESETAENTYKFSVEVAYTKDGSDDSKTIKVRGLINTDEKGKIVEFNTQNGEELVNALRK